MDKEIKVTGERDFGTGAQRDPNEDKGRFDLLSPLALMRLARHTQKGGQGRGDRNWEHGMPLSAVLDSAIRHIYKYILNELMGQEQDEDHLAAAMWNLMVATHFDELIDMGIGDPQLKEDLLGTLMGTYRQMSDERQEPNWEEILIETVMDKAKEDPIKYLKEQCEVAGLNADEFLKSCKNCFFSDYEGKPIRTINQHTQCSSCARLGKWEPALREK
jgi:hypothetical protein